MLLLVTGSLDMENKVILEQVYLFAGIAIMKYLEPGHLKNKSLLSHILECKSEITCRLGLVPSRCCAGRSGPGLSLACRQPAVFSLCLHITSPVYASLCSSFHLCIMKPVMLDEGPH